MFQPIYESHTPTLATRDESVEHLANAALCHKYGFLPRLLHNDTLSTYFPLLYPIWCDIKNV